MPGLHRGARLIVVEGDLERVLVMLDRLRVGDGVLRDVGDGAPVGAPRVRRHAGPGLGEPDRVAALHAQHPDLPLPGGGVGRHEGQPVARGRPLGRADAVALVRERAAGAVGHVHEVELAVRLVLLPVPPADDDRDLLAVGTDLRTAHLHEGAQVGEAEGGVRAGGVGGRRVGTRRLLRGDRVRGGDSDGQHERDRFHDAHIWVPVTVSDPAIPTAAANARRATCVRHYAASSHGPSVTTDSFFISGISAVAITVPITATMPSFMNRFV